MKKVILLAAAVAVLAGCQTEKIETPVPGLVKIVPVMTKVTDVNFENGDKVGVTIMQGDVAYAKNQLLTYSDNVFSGTLNWYAEALTPSTLTAYYPYAAEGAPSAFKVAADQTTGYGASDFIAGKKEGVTPSVNAVVVPFKHMLTKISLVVDNQSQAGISAVELRGSKTTADIDLVNMTAAVSEGAAVEAIKAYAVTAGELYSAIVVPQTVAFELSVTTSTGKELTQKLVFTELKQGLQYTINVKVMPSDIKVSISGNIENWGDGGEIGGDVPTYIDFAEYDGYFIYKNEKYTTVKMSDGSVWMSQSMRYVPEGYTVSSDPAAESHIWAPYTIVNGVPTPSTDADFVNKKGYLYDYQAIFGEEITVDNAASFEGKQGICPNGWHVPTRSEYLALCGYSAKGVNDEAAITKDDALLWDTAAGYGSVKKANELGWNMELVGYRQVTKFGATGQYLKNAIAAANTNDAALAGSPAITYIASSTFNKANYDSKEPTKLNTLQYFGMMTTFTSQYKDGRLSLAFVHSGCGMTLRCVKNK